jgi:acetylornithine/N-succinyldiaminopimelate aminotransferase
VSESEKILQDGSAVLFQNYRSFPLVLVRGEGCRVWDADGKRYLDLVAGIATVNLGHCHPAVVHAVQEQAARLFHVSNLYVNETQVRLARWLVDHSFRGSRAEARAAARVDRG